MALVDPLKDAIFVGLGATSNVQPPSLDYIPVDPTEADKAFFQAVLDLPDEGGILYVMPGSQPYRARRRGRS